LVIIDSFRIKAVAVIWEVSHNVILQILANPVFDQLEVLVLDRVAIAPFSLFDVCVTVDRFLSFWISAEVLSQTFFFPD